MKKTAQDKTLERLSDDHGAVEGSQLQPSRDQPAFQSNRSRKDQRGQRSFFLITTLPIVLLVVIVIALLVRAWPITNVASIGDLLTGKTWKPMQGQFGFFPFIAGTFWVTIVSLVLAVPPCLLTALFLSEYCRTKTAGMIKPFLDLLAGIPSVVYGVWGVVAIVPWVQAIKPLVQGALGFVPLFSSDNPTGYSILSGSIVLAVMIAPFIIAITYEVFRTVPDGAREASLAVGATRWQTVRHAVLPHTATGMAAGIVLGASRSLGETMAVLMVVGNVVQVPGSIFDAAYPLPALIANNYGEMMSIPMYDAALLSGALILLLVVLIFNLASTLVLNRIIKRRVF